MNNEELQMLWCIKKKLKNNFPFRGLFQNVSRTTKIPRESREDHIISMVRMTSDVADLYK